jgi:hypothetical protein
MMEISEKKRRRLLEQPQPVINRWMRRKMMLIAHQLARRLSRWKLPRSERERNVAFASLFETVKHYAIKNEHGKFQGTKMLFNIGLYLLIAHRDIQASKIDALTHPDEWTRKLHARIILLTIYEWDADKVTGRALKDAMALMHISDELQREAIGALRLLRTVQRKANRQFSVVRNKAIAHRDPDALAQYRAIRDLKEKEVMQIAVEFFEAVNVFINVHTRLLIESNTLQSYISQWSASEKSVGSDS